MCLIAIALRAEGFPLVLAANRDEDYERPTLPASFWPDLPNVLGGRDAVHGGTWLAVTESGRFAAVTNLRGTARDPDKRSRGELVSRFVMDAVDPRGYVDEVAARVHEYAGFHLLAGDRDRVVQLSGVVSDLDPGFHALSNAPAGERWPKVTIAEEEIGRIARLRDAELIVDAVLAFLSASRHTGSVESEVFVAGERYGTRSSTAIVITPDDRLYFAEQSYVRGGARDGAPRRFSYPLALPAR